MQNVNKLCLKLDAQGLVRLAFYLFVSGNVIFSFPAG